MPAGNTDDFPEDYEVDGVVHTGLMRSLWGAEFTDTGLVAGFAQDADYMIVPRWAWVACSLLNTHFDRKAYGATRRACICNLALKRLAASPELAEAWRAVWALMPSLADEPALTHWLLERVAPP